MNAPTAERFEHAPTDFVQIASPTVVYVGVASRAKFDLLPLHCTDSGENENGHVLTKCSGEYGGEVMVIFQHWIKSKTIAAIIADAEVHP